MHLNPARRGTRHLLGSPQRLHAAVLAGFQPDTPTETADGRVLWRIDSGAPHELTLWVSSPAAPDLTPLVEQAGGPTGQREPWQTASTAPLLGRLAAGQRWVFRLTANPVHSVRETGPDGRHARRGRRYAHVTADQQRSWLLARAAALGFTLEHDGVLALDVTGRRRVTFARRSEGASRDVTVSTATYDGVLGVTDPAALRRALCHGIGRAKGYGCGLLTLAPLT